MLRTLEDGSTCGLNPQINLKNFPKKNNKKKKHLSYPKLMNGWKRMFSFSKHMTEHNTGAQNKHKL